MVALLLDVRDTYIRSGEGFLLVFDVTDPVSFSDLDPIQYVDALLCSVLDSSSSFVSQRTNPSSESQWIKHSGDPRWQQERSE